MGKENFSLCKQIQRRCWRIESLMKAWYKMYMTFEIDQLE